MPLLVLFSDVHVSYCLHIQLELLSDPPKFLCEQIAKDLLGSTVHCRASKSFSKQNTAV